MDKITFQKKNASAITAEVIKQVSYKGIEYYYVKLPSGKKQHINKKYVIDDHPKT